MSRFLQQQLAQNDDARKNVLAGDIQSTMAKIPDDLTQQQKSDTTNAEMGGIDAGYGNLKDEMLRSASATGATANIPESLNEVGMEATRAKADAGANLDLQLANVPVQRALQQASVFQPALGSGLGNTPNSGPSTLSQIGSLVPKV